MGAYLITIKPEERSGAETTLRIETSGEQTLITELNVRAGDGVGLAPADLPALDLGALIAAVMPKGAVGTDAPAAGGPDVEVSPDGPEVSPGSAEGTVTTPATTTRTGRRGSARTTKSTGRSTANTGPVNTASARPAKAAKKTSSRITSKSGQGAAGARKATAKAASAGDGTGKAATREYRRMPAVEEVVATYRQLGGTTALAQHYGVPRHTATGWVRRLRSLGELPAIS
jgi:hypothetical protein